MAAAEQKPTAENMTMMQAFVSILSHIKYCTYVFHRSRGHKSRSREPLSHLGVRIRFRLPNSSQAQRPLTYFDILLC
jgi:hypothetical protein